MIITVTLNPALDKTATVDRMRPNALNRLREVTLDAGGKGVNVSAMIQALGGDSIAVGFSGGGSGEALLSLIAQKGLRHDFVHIADVTRTNLKVVANDGALTELNEPGPKISAGEWREIEQKLYGCGTKGNIVVLSGSLPAGLGTDTYKNLSTMRRQSGAEVFLDADGEALCLALGSAPSAVPDYIKPNLHELREYFRISDDERVSEAHVIALCRSLLKRGIKLLALSLGSEGAIFVNKNGVWRAPAVPVQVRSTVSAGDSMTGALAYGFEKGLPEERGFALAMAASAGACTTEGTNPPSRVLVDDLIKQVRIEKIA